MNGYFERAVVGGSTRVVVDVGRSEIGEMPLRGECDAPPKVSIWVGRESELRLARKEEYSVVALTGIGGQGKSCLASKMVGLVQGGEWGDFEGWDWRNCREQGARLHSILVSQVSRWSRRAPSAKELGESSIEVLVKLLFDSVRNRKLLFVYDNVDGYVDGGSAEPILGLQHVISLALDGNCKCKFIFTSRPEMRVAHPAFLPLTLGGLGAADSLSLFQFKNIDISQPEIMGLVLQATKVAHGHPLWLSIIAAQMSIRPGHARRIIESSLKNPEDSLTRQLLAPIWDSLAETEMSVLRVLAEALRPHSDKEVSKLLVGRAASLRAARRDLERLVNMNLIVYTDDSKYELHPLVRAFVQRRFSQRERSSFIGRIVSIYYDAKIALFGGSDVVVMSEIDKLSLHFERAELFVNADEYQNAIKELSTLAMPSRDAGRTEDFIRVSDLVFDRVDLTQASGEGYEGVYRWLGGLAESLAHFNDRDRAFKVLEEFRAVVSNGSIHYIYLCDKYCYIHWVFGEFDRAISWADSGIRLALSSGFDTDYDCRHNRALALRDSGRYAEARDEFLESSGFSSVESLIQSWGELDVSGAVYGNIGRCEYYLNNSDTSIKLLKMSYARLARSEDYFNVAYACEWLGDALGSLGEHDAASIFYSNAVALWDSRSPSRHASLVARHGDGLTQLSADQIVKYCDSFCIL